MVELWAKDGVICLGEPKCDVTSECTTSGEEELHKIVEFLSRKEPRNEEAEAKANDSLSRLLPNPPELAKDHQGGKIPFESLNGKRSKRHLWEASVIASLQVQF